MVRRRIFASDMGDSWVQSGGILIQTLKLIRQRGVTLTFRCECLLTRRNPYGAPAENDRSFLSFGGTSILIENGRSQDRRRTTAVRRKRTR